MTPEMMTAQAYLQEINQVFSSQAFMTGIEKEKREQVGTTIFKYVEKLVGEQLAPKITGMLIDLPLAELNYSVSTYQLLQAKVHSAYSLLMQTRAAPSAPSAPKPEATAAVQ